MKHNVYLLRVCTSGTCKHMAKLGKTNPPFELCDIVKCLVRYTCSVIRSLSSPYRRHILISRVCRWCLNVLHCAFAILWYPIIVGCGVTQKELAGCRSAQEASKHEDEDHGSMLMYAPLNDWRSSCITYFRVSESQRIHLVRYHQHSTVFFFCVTTLLLS